jgi:hypothetical protein
MDRHLPKVIDSIQDPDKAKLIVQMLKDEPSEKQRYIFVIEHIRVSKTLGFIKFEVFGNEKTLFRFKIQQNLHGRHGTPQLFGDKPADNFDWRWLKVGKKEYLVGLVDVASESLWEKIKKGIVVSLEQGRIPYISGLLPSLLGKS